MHAEQIPPLLETAKHLAAIGRYDAAQSLLSRAESEEDELPTVALLLMAKIFAQQGNSERAMDYWHRVLERDPRNSEANAGINRARHALKPVLGPVFRYSLSFQVCSLFLLIAMGSLVYMTARAAAGQRESSRETNTGQADTVGLKETVARAETTHELEELKKRVRILEANNTTTNRPPPAEQSPLIIEQLQENVQQLATRLDETDKQREQQLVRLEQELDNHSELNRAIEASSEAKLAELAETIDMKITPAIKGQQVSLQEVTSQLAGVESKNEKRYRDGLRARAEQLMMLELVHRGHIGTQNAREQLHDRLERVLNEIEATDSTKWENYVDECRKFLKISRDSNQRFR